MVRRTTTEDGQPQAARRRRTPPDDQTPEAAPARRTTDIQEPANSYGSESVGTTTSRHAGLVTIDVVVQGTTPVMMNAMSIEQLLNIRDHVKPPKNAAKPPIREEAESKLHRLPDGRPHVPATALYACLINAGQFVRLDGKRQISTEKKTVLPSMMGLIDTVILLTKHDSETPATWEVDIQRGRNPNGGEAVCIVRPRFDEWQLAFSLEVDQREMDLAKARDLVDIAGRRVGLLEFTPRHKGTFGTFKITKWVVRRGGETPREGDPSVAS